MLHAGNIGFADMLVDESFIRYQQRFLVRTCLIVYKTMIASNGRCNIKSFKLKTLQIQQSEGLIFYSRDKWTNV